MLDANYIIHCKALGKLARQYDNAGSSVTTIKTGVAATVDQIATGAVGSYGALVAVMPHIAQVDSYLNAGQVAMQTVWLNAGKAYLTGSSLSTDLTTTPATPTTYLTVLAALQTEMAEGVDNKTLGTKTTSGLVNFLDAMLGSSGTWNTESDATADYRDATYVVDAVV